jgi:galactonate dehydratase
MIPSHARARRVRLAEAVQARGALPQTSGARPLEIAGVDLYTAREPVSRRAYTLLRVRTRSGLAGWGECGAAGSGELSDLRRALIGREASAYEAIPLELGAAAPLAGGVDMALLDLVGKHCSAPIYRLLGGPTRHKARALAALAGATDAELAAAAERARAAGFRAFLAPLPRPLARNQGEAYVAAVRRRLETLRAAAGSEADFVLDGAAALTAGDAASVARALEPFRPLWLDEPCRQPNIAGLRKIAAETVVPLGVGRAARDAGEFQDLLREDAVDVIRPDVREHGITRVRKMAALAETYYVAVAPHHDGGPVSTAAALHLAAALPNFVLQQVPFRQADEDRALRAALCGRAALERPIDGFLELPAGPGLGIEIDERSLETGAPR